MRAAVMCAGLLSGLAGGRVAIAADPPAAASESAEAAETWNLELRTFGGKQLWTDEFVHGDWRIQRHVLSGHYRLLDDRNVRRAWGTAEQCRREFDRLKRELNLPGLGPRAVVVLHGLIRSRDSMANLCAYLAEPGEFSVLKVSYASTRGVLAEHAAALARIIEGLEGVDEVHFVAHSLGNLVVRHYLGDRRDGVHGNRTVPRLGRIVMIAPPNNGSTIAVRFRDNPLFQVVWGEAGGELAKGWLDVEQRLAIPDCPFGVIAGGKGDMSGLNPLLTGDDDFVVTVEETLLPGARDLVVVPALHGTIMNDPRVQEHTLRFLRHEYFVSEEARHPIPAGAPADQP